MEKNLKRFCFFLDSGGGSYSEIVYPDQIEWYKTTSAELKQKYGKTVALAFFHIPTDEYSEFYSKKLCFGDFGTISKQFGLSCFFSMRNLLMCHHF